ELVSGLPKSGLFVVSEKVREQVRKCASAQVVTYGKGEENDYRYDDVKTSKEGTSFTIYNNSNTYKITTSSLGDYMADNMTGCFVMAHQLGMEPETIIKHLESYNNIKRRFEKRFEGDITVFDDIAHSPTKAEKVLESIRKL